jgi:hypothetical protein
MALFLFQWIFWALVAGKQSTSFFTDWLEKEPSAVLQGEYMIFLKNTLSLENSYHLQRRSQRRWLAEIVHALNLPMAKAKGFRMGLTHTSRGSFRAQQGEYKSQHYDRDRGEFHILYTPIALLTSLLSLLGLFWQNSLSKSWWNLWN